MCDIPPKKGVVVIHFEKAEYVKGKKVGRSVFNRCRDSAASWSRPRLSCKLCL